MAKKKIKDDKVEPKPLALEEKENKELKNIIDNLRSRNAEIVDRLFSEGKVLDFIDSFLGNFIVREDKNRKFAYLALLNRPSQVFILGEASVGKTHLANTVLKTIPDWRVQKLGGSTEASLKYMLSELQEAIDVFYLQEYSGQNEATRQQLRLTSADDGGYKWTISVMNPETGRWEHEFINVGAISFLTTTAKGIDAQEDTRAIVIYPDSSVIQSKAIVEKEFQDWATPHIINKDLDYDKEICWAIYEEIRDLDITPVFPYGINPIEEGIVKVPFKTIKVRREKNKLRFITEAITKLNHRKRAKFFIDLPHPEGGLTRKGFVLVNLNDLILAIHLLQGQSNGSLSGLNPTESAYLEIIENILQSSLANEAPEPCVESKEVYYEGQKNNLNHAEDHVRRVLNNLAGKGFLIKDSHPTDGRKSIYIYTSKKKEFFEVDFSKARESFDLWFSSQEQEVKDYLSDDVFLHDYTTPTSEYRDLITDSVRTDKIVSRSKKTEENQSKDKNNSDNDNVGKLSEYLNISNEEAISRQDTDIEDIGISDNLESEKTPPDTVELEKVNSKAKSSEKPTSRQEGME